MALELTTVSAAGEIPLGKQHAGRTVAVEEIESGVWVVKAAQAIPDNELWLHEPSVARKLDRAIERAERDPNPPRETNLDELEAKVSARFGPKPGARRQRRK
jgi:hypothetical protein